MCPTNELEKAGQMQGCRVSVSSQHARQLAAGQRDGPQKTSALLKKFSKSKPHRDGEAYWEHATNVRLYEIQKCLEHRRYIQMNQIRNESKK